MRAGRSHDATLRAFGGNKISTFGEMLIVGLAVTAMSLPVVTLLPAIAAGTDHMDAHLDSREDSLSQLAQRMWAAVRAGWWFGTLWVLALAGLIVAGVLGFAGSLPGGTAYGVIAFVLAAAVAIVGLRAAARWVPGLSWRGLWKQAAADTVDDLPGTGYVVAGLLVAGVIIWMLPPMVIIAPGLIVVSLVATRRRVTDLD